MDAAIYRVLISMTLLFARRHFHIDGDSEFLFGHEPAAIMAEMACAGFGFYLIPHIGEWCIGRITFVQASVRNLLA